MLNKENIILVMNESTYEAVKAETFNNADYQPDPIHFIKRFSSIEIATDNEVPYGITEMWDKEQYYIFKSHKKGWD